MREKSSGRRLKLVVVAVTAAIAFFGFYNIFTKPATRANSSGPPPTHTGAPSEANCTQCHASFPVNSGGGSVQVSGLPIKYAPGAQYPVTVTVNHEGATVYGFQTTAVNVQGQTAGTYAIPSPSPANSPVQMQALNGTVNVGGTSITRRYVEHTRAGIIPTQFNTKSWTFNWTAPATRQGRVRFHAAGNGANSDGSTAGDYIYTTAAATCSNAANANFDGDAKGDVAVFRSSNGVWYRLNSNNGAYVATAFGQAGDKPVPGDFDGDGRNDIAVFRPSNGTWYIVKSGDGSFTAAQFGANGDVPVIGDFSGDGKSELTVFRPSNGTWYILDFNNNVFTATQFGQNGDKPAAGDYDADGKTDVAVFRPSNGTWYLLRSSSGFIGTQFGQAEDKPVQGDYDADGRTDIAVYRPSNGTWYLLRSTAGYTGAAFGVSTDVPAPADYDGDCQTDIAVYRSGNWYIVNSLTNTLTSVAFGAGGDAPLAATYIAE